MANSTSVENRGRKTTVALKVLMAVTGLFIVLFLLFHAFGNFKMFLGAEEYNHYADWLKHGLLYPILPKLWALWIFRIVLLTCIFGHMYAAIKLWKRGNDARGHEKYKVNSGSKVGVKYSYTAATMRYGGIIIALFVVFHILQYTVLALQLGGPYEAHDPYSNMIYGFSLWWVWLIYFISLGSIALHVSHGVWSALATLGLNTRRREHAFKIVAGVVGLAVFLGFMIPPTAILFGFIGA
ncbi:succinate dehydrogenase cytochrome b subunit [Arcanobacterium phocisimile]|uniref:Succinate dehydrogenase cytochrome b subunit n=1 Tax=Arcanobacterium phocisimile TaxID=1302235 RepID=A0ABX7IF89_9ACTO|nr:succinate dehydrogenase cytochrome b subunit [Arcanobacterium phocisimile]QRV01798.1 succinate dehydrogenase cytochrome b subunit [Arcanobacterium phocisimile]